MDENYFKNLAKTFSLLFDPNVSNKIKNETVKTVLKMTADIQPNFGELTKHDLKKMIDFASDWESLYIAMCTYFSTHNISY